MFNRLSVFPTCELATTAICFTLASPNASMISFMYGVLAVRQLPASALFSGDNLLYLSAHSETVRSSGALKPLQAFWKRADVLMMPSLLWSVLQALSLPFSLAEPVLLPPPALPLPI